MATTIWDIAKRCNCSTTTISKVFNNKGSISKGKREEILRVSEELGYVRSESARSLASKAKKTNLIGIILHINENKSITHELFSGIINAFRIEMEKENYDICFLRNVKEEGRIDYNSLVNVRGISGVLVLSANENDKKVAKLLESDVPCVTFDMPTYANNVSSNNEESVREMVSYLVKQGHRRIVYAYPKETGVAEERKKGFVEGIRENGLELDENMIIKGSYYYEGSAKEITERILASNYKPTAIMYPDDYTAISAITYLKNNGHRVPGEISVTGFDGVEISSLIRPSLVTIKQDTKAIGQKAAEVLLGQINKKSEKENKIEIKTTLIKGDSVKKIN